MKIGDKVICIKTRESSHTKGELYKIKEISDKSVLITSDNNIFSLYYLLYENSHYCKFKDYFITLKEMRKLKLEKIKKIY